MITCRFEHGSEASLRHVTVDTVVVNEDDQLLLVKRADFLGEGGKWALPGGYVDRDEHLFEAARREVLEETGYESSDYTLLSIFSDPNRSGDDRQNVSFCYFATPGALVGAPDHETADLAWFAFDQLPDRATLAFDHANLIDNYLNYKSGAPIPMVN